eukprot:3363657-Prymnesium_polylepis.1
MSPGGGVGSLRAPCGASGTSLSCILLLVLGNARQRARPAALPLAPAREPGFYKRHAPLSFPRLHPRTPKAT